MDRGVGVYAAAATGSANSRFFFANLGNVFFSGISISSPSSSTPPLTC